MTPLSSDPQAELEKIRRQLESLETQRGVLPDAQIEEKAAELNRRQTAIENNIQIAGEGGVVGSRAGRDIYAGKENVFHIHKSPTYRHLQRNYLNRLYRRCQGVSMEGIDPQTAAGDAGARLNLDAVYTALLTQSREEDQQPKRANPARAKALSALTQLNRHKYLVLLGDPGSGKSVFINFTAMCMAGERLTSEADRNYSNLKTFIAPLPKDDGQDGEETQTWNHGALLPIRIILRDFVSSAHFPETRAKATAAVLWRFIEDDLAKGELQRYLTPLQETVSREPTLLLLDGLDEVPDAEKRRQRLKQVILDFKECNPHCRILITSRIYAYQEGQAWRLPNDFKTATLAPFSPGQIRRFIDRWYAFTVAAGRREKEDAQGRAELLKRVIFRNVRLRALAERPLLLTLMSSLHDWRGGSLPERRELLYEDTVELLLETWEMRQKIKRNQQGNIIDFEPSLGEWLRVDKNAMRRYLNRLAFEIHRRQDKASLRRTADIPQDSLITGLMALSERDDVRPRQLINYLSQRAGILPARGNKVYAFPHRSIQEYLAASYLSKQEYPDKVAELARQDPERWRETTLLAGLIAAAGTESPMWDTT